MCSSFLPPHLHPHNLLPWRTSIQLKHGASSLYSQKIFSAPLLLFCPSPLPKSRSLVNISLATLTYHEWPRQDTESLWSRFKCFVAVPRTMQSFWFSAAVMEGPNLLTSPKRICLQVKLSPGHEIRRNDENLNDCFPQFLLLLIFF